MAASPRLERAPNRTFEVAVVPDAGWRAVKTGSSLLKLNEVVQQALPERVDVYE